MESSIKPTFLLNLKSFGICFHTKKKFQKLFIPLQSLFIITDRVYLALLTASTVIGVMTGGHLIRWPKYLTALTKLEIRSDRVNSNSTNTLPYRKRRNNKLLMFIFCVCSQTPHMFVGFVCKGNDNCIKCKKLVSLEVMKSLIDKEISLLQTHYNW